MSAIDKKLVIIGDGAVGKTCLCIVQYSGKFPEEYIPNVIDYVATEVNIDGKTVKLHFYDTGGGEDYHRLRPLCYRDKDCFLMCFSIASPNSFANISQYWSPEVNNYQPDIPVVLVGNKIDLRNDIETMDRLSRSNQQPITSKQGKAMAKKIKAFAYMECSAYNKNGVTEVFETAARVALQLKRKERKKATCDLM